MCESVTSEHHIATLTVFPDTSAVARTLSVECPILPRYRHMPDIAIRVPCSKPLVQLYEPLPITIPWSDHRRSVSFSMADKVSVSCPLRVASCPNPASLLHRELPFPHRDEVLKLKFIRYWHQTSVWAHCIVQSNVNSNSDHHNKAERKVFISERTK